MPTFPDHYRAQFGGTLRGDIWSVNMNFMKMAGAPITGARQLFMAQALEVAFKVWMATSGGGFSSAVVLTYTKFNRIAPDGSYADPNNTWQEFNEPPTAGVGTPTLANSDALAVTWTTSVTRGYASRGRIFLPCPAVTIAASTGKVANTGLVANAAAVFVNSANSIVTDGGEVGRMVVVSGVVPPSGDFHAVTGVRVGDVMDTQRRRRNALIEAYTVNTTAIT